MKFAGKSVFLALMSLVGASQVRADPAPYAPIAISFPDSGVDQRVRDSATLKIGRVRVNQAGYRTMDVAMGTAKFYYVGAGVAFTVVDTATHASVGTGVLVDKGFKSSSSISVRASNWAGLVSGGDLRYTLTSAQLGTSIPSTETFEGTLPSTLLEGHYYRVAVGKDTSVPFLVSNNIYGYVRDGVLKFFGVNRSGDGPSWFHAPSHLKDGYLATPSNPGAYKGGWYDCGDHLKEPQTMAYALSALAMLTATMPSHDADHYGLNHAKTLQTDGIPDILAEAHFGAQFFLKSWMLNKKATAGMISGVGDFGKDHGWWGRAENQDAMTETGRGGYKERTLRSELGANTVADVAGALAILSKRYRPYDAKFADSALAAAKDMYAYAKANLVVVNSPAYNGAGPDKVNANLALAATALLWVTKDKAYLNDIAYDKTIGNKGQTFTPLASWTGGWMVMSNPNLTKGSANTDWANRNAEALYAFYKLILANPDSALSYGVASEAERQNLIAHTIAGVIQNLSSIGQGTGYNIPLPTIDPNQGVGSFAIKATAAWFVMYTQQEWVWNRYQMGNAAELYFYYDITKDLEAGLGGTMFTQFQWKRDDVRQLMLRMFDYQLGMNPWDVSMIFGLGKKNFNHPHHRTSNPEGRNTPGSAYRYTVPVGALYGSWNPETSNDASAPLNVSDFNDYWHAEVCLDGAATTLMPAAGLAMDEPLNIPPHATVKVLAALDTTADIEVDLDKYGTVVLNYGTAQGTYTKTVKSDSSGVIFKFHLGGLTVGTQYFFDVVTTDLVGNDTTQDHWINPAPDGTPYNFTTLPQLQGGAQIANVKVCNVTADSAEIMWYTPNGQYQSSICYGTMPPVGSKTSGTTTCVMDADITGHATKFHYVKIGGLQEQTTYYFKVASDGSNGIWDDNGGIDYKFTTPVRMANFSVYAVQYTWSSMPALAINVINNEARSYDSLSLRVYVRSKDTVYNADGSVAMHIKSTQTGLVNVPMLFKDVFAARYDICQAYDGAGFNKPCGDPANGGWGTVPGSTELANWGTLNRGVQMLPPVKMPDTYDPATNTSVFYFDLPLGPTTMNQGSRIRFDVIFAKRSPYSKTLAQPQLDLINWVKSFVPSVPQYAVGDTGWYDVLDTALAQHPMGSNTNDWSWMPHSTANGDPVDFIGIPKVADQTAANAIIDNPSDNLPLDPYFTVYRKGVFVYGFSPSATEQATKKTYWGVKVKLDPPFDVPGATITLDRAASTVTVTGTADVYDLLTPAAKGAINDIWVNGVRLTPAQLATAATKDPATGFFNLKIPVRLGVGGNDVDITIFGGAGNCSDTAITCASGCAFYDANFFIQFTKGKSTQSTMALVDGANSAVGPLVTPDSSSVNVRVADNDNNLSPKAKDKIKVTLTDLRTGLVNVLTLTETGDSTGIFESGLLSVVGTAATAGQISVPRGDSVLVKYIDANDPEDSSQAYLYAKSAWPTPVSARLIRDCGGSYSVKALFDIGFAPGGWDSARVVLKVGSDSIVEKVAGSAISADAAGTTLTIPLPPGLSSGSLTGRLDIKEAKGQGGWIRNSVAISDGIGPWVDSVKIAENISGSGTDSVFFWASEPFTSTSPWPFLVRRSGMAVASTNFAGSATAQLLDAQTGKYLVVLPSGTLLAGDTIRFDPALVADGKGNAALDCPGGRKVQVISVLFAGLRASLFETCGGAYSVTALFNKPFPVIGGFDSGFVTLSNGTKTVGPFGVPASAITKDASGKILTFPLPGLTFGSDWTGTLNLRVVNDSGRLYSVSVPVSDSVGPWIDSAKVVENLTGNPKDSLFFWSSEPLSAGSLSVWPLLVSRSGTAVPAATFAGSVVTLVDAVTGKYQVVLPAGAIAAGDSLRLDPSMASDAAGNPAQNCPNAKRVTVLSRPAPFSRAWILDANGDGRADRVVVVFGKVVQAKDLPDLVQIRFGTGDSVRTAAVNIAQVTDSVLTLDLATPFPFGITLGSGTNGAGSISVSKSGEFTGPYALADSVGPDLLTAGLRYGTTVDTLDLVFSEPVKGSGAIGWLLAQPSLELGIIAQPVSLSPTHWRLPVNSGSVSPGDSVRPVPTENWVEARSNRQVPASHPWIPVTGGERAPLGGWFRDSDGDGAVDQAVVVFARAPKTRPGMRLLWPSASGGFDTAVVDSGSWTLDPIGTTATISVGPFTKGITSSPTADLGRWISAGTWSFRMDDSVPPVLVSAEVRYSSKDGSSDSLHVRWSEPLVWSGMGSLVRHQLDGNESPLGTQASILYDPDGLGGFLLLDSGTVQLRRGDSAAFTMGTVQDKSGNVVPQTTRWVPVKFGLRPARLDFELRSWLEYQDWDPRPGAAAQVWVRARGDAQWLFADSSAVQDTSHTVAVILTLNRILTGAAYIYDNAGTYVTSVDFTNVAKMAAQNKLPMDPSGMFQMKITWSGRTEKETWASSGIYLMRLVLKDSSPDNPHGLPGIVNRVYKLGFKRATK